MAKLLGRQLPWRGLGTQCMCSEFLTPGQPHLRALTASKPPLPPTTLKISYRSSLVSCSAKEAVGGAGTRCGAQRGRAYQYLCQAVQAV